MTVPTLLIFILGFISQVLFFARTFVQWILSEKAGKILSPLSFWKISLLASIIMLAYGFLRNDLAIIVGQLLVYYIYIRNLHLQNAWKLFSTPFRVILIMIPPIELILFFIINKNGISLLFRNGTIPPGLMLWGIAAQLVFTFRFFYQWLFSEKHKASHLPIGFWYISIFGSLMIMAYALIRHDPVLFLGHLGSMALYLRNVLLHYTGKGILDWLPVEKRRNYIKIRTFIPKKMQKLSHHSIKENQEY